MTNLSRRSFLGGVLALSAAVTVPLVRAMPIKPQLFADGVHDDTEALQALFDGNPMDVMNDAVRVLSSDEVYVNGGHYLISRPLKFRAGRFVSLYHLRMDAAPDFVGDCMIDATDAVRDETPSIYLGSLWVDTSRMQHKPRSKPAVLTRMTL